MEDLVGFVSIIIIVFGILQIILFFKLWGMTNDVRKLRKQVAPNYSKLEIIKCLVFENKAKAKEIVINNFIKKISDGDYAFSTLKQELEENLKKLNEEIPQRLKDINSTSEFYDLF